MVTTLVHGAASAFGAGVGHDAAGDDRLIVDATSGPGWRQRRPWRPIRFRSPIRYWNPDKQSGLAVTDVPAKDIAVLGGLRQQRVHGTIDGASFTSNVMPAGGGRLSLSVSKAMMKAAGASVGDEVEVEISRIGRD